MGERRRWSDDFKDRAIAASLEPGVNISALARSLDITPSQLFSWRSASSTLSTCGAWAGAVGVYDTGSIRRRLLRQFVAPSWSHLGGISVFVTGRRAGAAGLPCIKMNSDDVPAH